MQRLSAKKIQSMFEEKSGQKLQIITLLNDRNDKIVEKEYNFFPNLVL